MLEKKGRARKLVGKFDYSGQKYLKFPHFICM